VSGNAPVSIGQANSSPRVSHAVLLTSAQLARGLFRLVFVVAVARVLGPAQFGLYALLLAAVEIFAVASGSGYGDYLTREAARDERLGWGLAGQLVGVRLLCVAPLLAAGLGILRLIGYPRQVLLLTAFLSVSLLPRCLSEVVQGVLRGIGRYLCFLVVELALGLTLAGGGVVLLVQRGGLTSVIEIEIAGAAMAGMAALLFAIKYRTRERLRLEMSHLLKTSGIFNIYGFIGNLYDRVDVLMLSKLAGDYATGIYGAAYRPIGAVQLLPYGILYSLLPGLSRGSYSQAERERFERAMGLLLCAAFVIVLVTTAFVGPVVRLLLGTSYAGSAIALKILVWAVVFRYTNYALNIVILAAGHERVFVITSAICLATNFVANLVFIPMYTWRAAAAITVFTELVLFGQNIYWLRRLVGRVPSPLGWARASFVFVVLWLALFIGGRFVSAFWIGAACLILFLSFLYWTGMMAEFAAVWRQKQSQSPDGLLFLRAKA
jgi:O-antigen/teichoic acid export membrane protein